MLAVMSLCKTFVEYSNDVKIQLTKGRVVAGKSRRYAQPMIISVKNRVSRGLTKGQLQLNRHV